MADNHEQLRNLAEGKREADEYHGQRLLWSPSPELDRIARFFWWIVGGLLAGSIAVTIWVTNITASVSTNATRLTSLEAVEKAASIATAAQDRAEALQNTTIVGIQKELDNRAPMIKEHQELWFMRQHGIPNREAFRQEHGYYPPGQDASDTPTPTPRK